MYKILLPLLLVSFLNAAVYDGVAIVVKDKTVTLFEIKEKMQTLHIDAKKAADMLVREKLEEIEISERKITAENTEVYDEISQTAARNKLSVSEFYEAVRNANGLTSTELKDKIKQRLLTQKLYVAIAYTALAEPTLEEIQEYYELHKENYKHPSAFDVVVYQANDKKRLQEKIDNPMFYSPDIKSSEQTLVYKKISPELARLLEKTQRNHFTPALPDGQKSFISFYIKGITTADQSSFEDMQEEIKNSMMQEQREAVLSDYFARLRQNLAIDVVRMPE
jgi:peptidyl-prolyl cis-trans isomerase SurA